METLIICLRGWTAFSFETAKGDPIAYVEEDDTTDKAAGVLCEVEVGVTNNDELGTATASRGDSLSSRFGPKNTAFKSALPS